MKVTGERFVPGKMFKHSEIEHMHRYTAVAPLLKGKVVLDAACGTGYGSNMLAREAERVCGIDISQEAIAYANENFGATENVEYQIGDITHIPYPESTFDVVVSFETIEHVNEKLQYLFLKEIKRVLKEDGILIMSTPNKEIYTIQQGNQATEWHVKEFLEEEYHDFIQSEFQYVKYIQQYISHASYLTDETENEVALYNSQKDKKGKFIIAIASDSEIPDKFQLNSVYYYPDEYAKLTDMCQVYYADKETEFTEDRCELIEISGGKGIVEFSVEMEDDGSIGRIRVDPCAKTCAIRDVKIEIIGDNSEVISAINVQNNADVITHGIDWFYHRDPQYILTMEENSNVKKLHVKYEIIDYDIDPYAYFEKQIEQAHLENIETEQMRQKALRDMQVDIQELQNGMLEKQNDIQELQNGMLEKQNDIQELQSDMQKMRNELEYYKNRSFKQMIADCLRKER